jgi:hypothetical protein
MLLLNASDLATTNNNKSEVFLDGVNLQIWLSFQVLKQFEMLCRLINNKFRYLIIPNLLKKGGLVKNPKRNYFLNETSQIGKQNKTKSERFPEEKVKSTNLTDFT